MNRYLISLFGALVGKQWENYRYDKIDLINKMDCIELIFFPDV